MISGEILPDQTRQRIRGGKLHLVVDLGGADIERPAENPRERQHVVDLIRQIASPGRRDRRAMRLGLIRKDLRNRVRTGKDDRILCHRLHHLPGQHARSGDSDENVRPPDGLGERTDNMGGICDFCKLGFRGIQIPAAGIDCAAPVADDPFLCARAEQKLRDRGSGGAGAIYDEADLIHPFFNDFQRVEKPGERDDRSAVLIVMENRDIADFLKPALDLKAARRGYILEVDAAEAAREQRNGPYDIVRFLGADAERDGIHAAELLEEHALALHDRHPGLRANVAEAENRGAVGDDRHGVPPASQLVALGEILLDLKTGCGDARRIGQRKGFRRIDGHLGVDRQLSAPFVMRFQGFFLIIQRSYLLLKSRTDCRRESFYKANRLHMAGCCRTGVGRHVPI